MGVDDSDSDKFKISLLDALGAVGKDFFTITSTGQIGGNTSSPDATATYHWVTSGSMPNTIYEETRAGFSVQLEFRNPVRDWWVQADSSPDVFCIEDRTYLAPSYDPKPFIIKGGANNIGFWRAATSSWGNNALRVGTVGIVNTAPTTSPVDAYQFWAEDFGVGGTVCPFFRTENDVTVKLNQNVGSDGSPTFVHETLTQATGVAPLTITSTTMVANLNVQYLNGKTDTDFGPAAAKYIVQEADGTLTNEQALEDLATGIVKNTTGTGVLSIALAGTDYEVALGNPALDGMVLSSTALGVRSWIAAGGALAVDDLTDVNAPAPADNDILRFDTASGDWMNEALPAGGAHDTLSATHTDTLASAVSRGSIIYGNSTPKWAELAVGNAGQVITTDGTDVMWGAGASGAPTAAQYLTLAAHADLTAERILSPQGTIKSVDGGAGLSYYLTHGLKYKTSSDTPDDDFTADALDVKWTVVDGAAGSVSLLGSAGNIYDLTTRDSYLLVQAINGDEFQIRQDYTLPDHSSIILCVSGSVSFDGAPAITNNELWAGLGINDNDAGFNSGTYQILFFDTDLNNVRGHHYSGSTQGALPAGTFPIGQKLYCRFAREGLTYYAFMSIDGETWLPMGSVTVAGAYTNVWVFVDSQATVSTPVPIQAFDWIRLGTNAVDPW
jgi:hypothetical protein